MTKENEIKKSIRISKYTDKQIKDILIGGNCYLTESEIIRHALNLGLNYLIKESKDIDKDI